MKLDCETNAAGSGREFGTKTLEAQPIVGIRATAPMSEVASVMGPLFGEVHGYIQGNGGTPAGMPLTIYHSPPGKRSSWNARFRSDRRWPGAGG